MKSPFIQLAAALGICLAALAGYAAWYAAIAHTSSVVANLESQIQTRTETGSRIASARATLAEIANDEVSVQAHFVPETGVVAFITDLEGRATAQGAVLSVLSVATSNVGARPTLTLAVSVKGTFSAVMRTLGSIEYSPRDLSISTLTLAHDDETSWHADLKLVVGSASTSPATSSRVGSASTTKDTP